MSYGTRSGLNFIQVIFPVLWRSSRVHWGSGFWCPTSYGWSIACQNFCKTDRNNIVSMVVVKTIWCMYTVSGIKTVKIDVATSYLVLATFIGVWLYLQNCKSESVLVVSIFETKVWCGCDRLHIRWLYTQNSCFSQSNPHEHSKSLPWRQTHSLWREMVLKAKVKVVQRLTSCKNLRR